MRPLHAMRVAALTGFGEVERLFDAAFGSGQSPLRQLGALGCLLFALLFASGFYLYVVLDTSADGAYRSIDALSRAPWNPGALMRSLHRYAADAFVIVVVAHLLREALYGRYSGFRRYSWLTGIPLLLLVYVNGIGGFWLNWDQLGQFSALASAEWLDRLPLFASPFARNFLRADNVGDRLFSLLIFIHVGVPVLLAFGLWFHLQRIARAAIYPPRRLAAGTLVVLLALSLAAPVTSQGAADMHVAPAALAYDWLLLAVHPVTYAASPAFVWWALAAVAAGLVALAYLPQPAAPPVAVVDAVHCNGCRRCVDDCPYSAVTMVRHPLRGGRELAQVDADLCASCGICAGACPAASPFRNVADLRTGIDMPAAPIGVLRERLGSGLAALGERGNRIAVFGCDHGVDVRRLAAADVAPVSLACVGQLPPSFVEYALRDGAAGVLVTGCAEGTCEYRLGQQWCEERLRGTREPHLRATVPAERLATAWVDARDESAVRDALQSLRQRLAANAARAAHHAGVTHG